MNTNTIDNIHKDDIINLFLRLCRSGWLRQDGTPLDGNTSLSPVSMSLLYTGNVSVGGQELSSSGRKYVVYNEDESDPICDSSGSISTFTFLNFLASSVSLAALLGSNSNSNNNNNNQNNNQECLSTS